MDQRPRPLSTLSIVSGIDSIEPSQDSQFPVFGYKYTNARLLADEYAKAGFYVYVPDVLFGDALPIEFLQDVEPNLKTQASLGVLDKAKKTASVGTTLGPWLIKHREAVSKPIIDKFIDDVKAIPGTGKVGAIGFCWGGRYAILAGHTGSSGSADAVYACHPSLVTIPGDFEPVSKPTAIAIGDHDSLLDTKSIDQIKDIFAKREVETEVRVYNDQVHGFSVRGDWSSDKDKKAMDDALGQGVSWFNKFLS
jgi:dienelactone hydrolase